MRKNAKIIQINGLRGLLVAFFIVTCLAAGFVVFPGFVAMNLWNKFAINLPQINLYQGILLWAIVAIIYFITTKQSFAVSFGAPKELSEEELRVLMNRVKIQSQARIINKMIAQNLEELQKEEHSKEDTASDNESLTK